MRIEQVRWQESRGWDPAPTGRLASSARLVLIFGSRRVLLETGGLADLRRFYPEAQQFGCSTAGEICGTQVLDDTLVATAVEFRSTRVLGARVAIAAAGNSFNAGAGLARGFPTEGLLHLLVLSDGIAVNGSELVAGLTQNLPAEVTVTGGLSADGDRFQETFVIWNGVAEARTIAALGFYGDALRIGFGSLGGWDPFGPERLITRAEGNVLYELDGRSALALYKEYLGEHAAGLPATGLLFPLSLRTTAGVPPVVRTILSVDEARQSLTFAGDVPRGAIARLMKANFDRLLDGAAGAARTSHQALSGASADLAILISCVGRKLLLKQRIEEEIEGVREVLGERPVLAGFYSYGEIAPFTPNARCELHNQTMTITAFSER